MSGVRRFSAWLESLLGPLPSLPAWRVSLPPLRRWLGPALVAGACLGLAVSVRVLGPLAGLLVGLVFLLRPERRSWAGLLVYALAGGLVALATWPYLWEKPLGHFLEVFRMMSNNPQIIPVLFNGAVLQSDKLPASYLPVMLGLTLSEPVWLLFLGGLCMGIWRAFHRRLDWTALLAVVLWFWLPFGYVILRRPPMYDGYRHFLFILPPVFVLTALALEALFQRLRRAWLNGLLLAAVLLPGVIPLIALQPYPYTYYNNLVGGLGGAFRRFETDYWLT
jgi:hypothetical protein